MNRKVLMDHIDCERILMVPIINSDFSSYEKHDIVNKA